MIRLEPFVQDDFQQLIDWVNEEALLTAWSGNLFSFPLTMTSLEWYVRDTNNVNSSEAFVYKAVDETGRMVGHISLGSISWKNSAARLTRVLVGDPQQRGKGCCYEIVKAALKIAFDDLNLHRIELGVYSGNPAASRCYERAGFVTEGIRRDILWHKDKWCSMIEMSILEEEWRSSNL
jgi:RimJ/RimL family protein N-acetyltransferase